VLLEAGRVIADGKSAKVLQDSTLLRRLGLRRPAPEPLADWDQLLQPNGTYPVNEQPILTLQNVDASYGKTTVLHDLSLSFWPGEFVALVGENGAGKSTLAMIAAGLKRPNRGRVALRGQKGVRLGLDVGLLFQNPLDQLFCDTVEEEIAFGPRNYDCFHPETHGRTMVECDLTAIRERPARALSAGQQQRVALGAVLALRPALLIVDEPTLGQDWGHLERLMSFLCHLNEQGTTILMITHDYKLVHRYADRVVLLHEGRVVADGQPIRRERRQEHEIYTA
jgi:energy-coupling factor transport system ATP-binding protein